ncbi:adenylate/guanylate cyclase [Actinobacteria bacterium OV450]|nr:adenylate/guanylate cyclase [Actinobacteria bacterium OV450]
MTGRRSALLIATSRYENRALQQLRSPVRDVEGLTEVLQDQRIGDFQVTAVVDGRHYEINRAVEQFFLERSRRDFLLLHISCHGILNNYGELYFAARDTDRKLLGATAVSSTYLRTQMDRCRARSIVVLLDCCYSGAFLRGGKGDTEVHVAEELAGHGRAILTATNHTEYAWEGNLLDELDPEPSRFTGAIIEGLRSGEADGDRDGRVSVQDLYEYVCEQMRADHVAQSPQLSAEVENKLWVAHSLLNARHEKKGQMLDRGRMTEATFPQEWVGRRLAVGFAELVGFTRLTRRLNEEELGELVEIFQTAAADLVSAHGGQLIKTLGDEVRYAADDAGAAAEIALRLIETMESHESMPELGLRVGIAFGTVTTRMGDVFGTTVSLASALRSLAPIDAALVDSAFTQELIHTGEAPASEAETAEAAAEKEPPTYRFVLQPMWQRPVRELGQVQPWVLARRANSCG